MTNHVHLVATPHREESLAKAVGRTHFLYTQYVNRLHGRSGHLWQNRFFSCALRGVHFWRTLCYVKRNPVRAKLVRVPWRYRWSSAAAHVSGEDPTSLLDMGTWAAHWTGEAWQEALRQAPQADEVAKLRLATHRGRPLATDSFLSKLERRLGRRVRPRPVGRPKQAKPAKQTRTNSASSDRRKR